MDGIERQICEERPVAVLGDESLCFSRESLGQVLARRPVRQTRVLVWSEVIVAAPGPAVFPTTLVDVEALVLRPVTFGAEVPFSSEKRGVATLLERLRQRDLFQRHPV